MICFFSLLGCCYRSCRIPDLFLLLTLKEKDLLLGTIRELQSASTMLPVIVKCTHVSIEIRSDESALTLEPALLKIAFIGAESAIFITEYLFTLTLQLTHLPISFLVLVVVENKLAETIEAVLGEQSLIGLPVEFHQALPVIVAVAPLADVDEAVVFVEADPGPVQLARPRRLVPVVQHPLPAHVQGEDLPKQDQVL